MSVTRMALSVAGGLALAGAGFFSWPLVSKPAAPKTWDMTPLEIQSVRHAGEKVDALRAEIASIASGDEAAFKRLMGIAARVQRLDQDDEELRREAEKHTGVAVVQSGATWVERR